MGNDPLRPRHPPAYLPALPDPFRGDAGSLPGGRGRGTDTAHAVMRRGLNTATQKGHAGGGEPDGLMDQLDEIYPPGGRRAYTSTSWQLIIVAVFWPVIGLISYQSRAGHETKPKGL
jgi:hypothetical protein